MVFGIYTFPGTEDERKAWERAEEPAHKMMAPYDDKRLTSSVRLDAITAGLFELASIGHWQAILDILPGPQYFARSEKVSIVPETLDKFNDAARLLSNTAVKNGGVQKWI